jgi:hypothetical protein
MQKKRNLLMFCYVIIDDGTILSLTKEEVYDPSEFNLVKKLYLQNQAYINRYYKVEEFHFNFRLDKIIENIKKIMIL